MLRKITVFRLIRNFCQSVKRSLIPVNSRKWLRHLRVISDFTLYVNMRPLTTED